MDRKNQSIKVFDQNGFINLIKEHQIGRTRTLGAVRLAEARFSKEEFFGRQLHADYAFVSRRLINEFHIPRVRKNQEHIFGSDHLPLFLNVSGIR